jgi:hypothetical protein
MSKKEYIAITVAIQSTELPVATRAILVGKLAVEFSRINETFNHREFRRDCGVN